jgi:hypothetical protein
MPIEQITVPLWLSVTKETRDKLRELFLIPKSASCEVVTNEMGVGIVISDGTTNVDLQQLSVPKMIDYLGTAAIDETVYDLFKRCIEKIETIVISTPIPSIEKPLVPIAETLPQNDIKADSKVVGDTIKCEKCEFQTASKFAMRMHVGKKHK